MKAHACLQEDGIVRRAIDTLLETLGLIETVRFLTLPSRRRLDSVMRRRRWQETLDKDRFFDRVFGAEEIPLNGQRQIVEVKTDA